MACDCGEIITVEIDVVDISGIFPDEYVMIVPDLVDAEAHSLTCPMG